MADEDVGAAPGDDEDEEKKRLPEEQVRDPDEAMFAEEAIQHYSTDALELFRNEVESALSAFTAWTGSFDQQAIEGYRGEIGKVFLREVVGAFGGAGSLVGAIAFEHLDGVVDMAIRQEPDMSFFINELSRGARDVTWTVRDNLKSILSNQWDDLCSLAYEGSTDFIPALHSFGLPQTRWSGHGLQSTLTAVTQVLVDAAPKTQEEAAEKDPEQQQAEIDQVLAEEEEKQQLSMG